MATFSQNTRHDLSLPQTRRNSATSPKPDA